MKVGNTWNTQFPWEKNGRLLVKFLHCQVVISSRLPTMNIPQYSYPVWVEGLKGKQENPRFEDAFLYIFLYIFPFVPSWRRRRPLRRLRRNRVEKASGATRNRRRAGKVFGDGRDVTAK